MTTYTIWTKLSPETIYYELHTTHPDLDHILEVVRKLLCDKTIYSIQVDKE